jgi:sec-independent protein translocase protein TatC
MQDGKGAKAQPFSEHLRELRQRLIYIIATLFLGCMVGYAIHDKLFHIVTRPLHEKLYYTTPTGGFNAVIKISILFGVIVTVPVLVYQVGKFLSPTFRRRIRAVKIILFSVFLAITGILFAYYISLPASLHFLANIGSANLQSLITVTEYLNFVFAYVAGFALLFQLPLIMLFINRIKPQRPGGLMRVQRYVILISFILAAILTPTPDPMNQLIMALPIILLYQFSVILIWFVNRRSKVVEIESIPVVQDVPAVPEAPATPQAPAAAGYSAAAYSSSTPFSSPEPPATPPAYREPPRLIMDIFPVPQKPHGLIN